MTMATIIGLIAAGFLLLFFEIFIPGGMLGLLGAVAILIGIVGAFASEGPIVGGWLLCGCMFVAAIGFWLWAKYFPKSRMGRKVILQDDASEWHGFDDSKQELLGKEGVTHAPLHPTGIVLIDGKRIDVITRGEMLPKDTAVKVIKVEGNRVIVTKLEP